MLSCYVICVASVVFCCISKNLIVGCGHDRGRGRQVGSMPEASWKRATPERRVEQNISENHSASEPQSAPPRELLTMEQEPAQDISSRDNDAPIATDLPRSVQQGVTSDSAESSNEAVIPERRRRDSGIFNPPVGSSGSASK